jgi:hypothetical protein
MTQDKWILFQIKNKYFNKFSITWIMIKKVYFIYK